MCGLHESGMWCGDHFRDLKGYVTNYHMLANLTATTSGRATSGNISVFRNIRAYGKYFTCDSKIFAITTEIEDIEM